MKLTGVLGGVIAAAAILTAGAAVADTKVVNLTLDLNAQCIDCGYIEAGPGFVQGPFSIDLAIGDTLDLTVDFLGDQQLTVTNLFATFPSIWTSSDYVDSSSITQTGTLSLLNSLGVAIYTSPVISKSDCCVHAGQYVNGGELVGLPSVVTFSGMRWVGTIDAYDGVYTTRNYTHPVYYIDGEDTAISSSGAIPEPATWALMIGGFGLAGSALRRRRALVV